MEKRSISKESEILHWGSKALLLIVLIEVFGIFADEDEHVHFRIHVPEIYKHHVHTHTVYIHVHHPAKKKKLKKPEHVYNEHEDWSVHDTYSKHGGYHEEYGTEEGNGGGNNDHLTTQYPSLVTHKSMDQAEPPIPFYDDFTGEYPKPKHVEPFKTFRDGVSGYNHPPQYINSNYEVTENVNETPASYEQSNYQESNKSGGELQHGYIYNSNVENIYNNKIEESSENIGGESEEEHYGYLGSKYIRKQNG